MNPAQGAYPNGGVVAGVPAPRTDPRRLGRLATSDAEVNIRLLAQLAEIAVTSGDVRGAVEAVRLCTAEAQSLYQLAVEERSAAVADSRVAAEEHARALVMQKAAAAELDRAIAMEDEATAQRNRAVMMQGEASAMLSRAVAMRSEVEQAKTALEQAMEELEAQRKAYDEAQRKANERKRTAIPRRLRVSDPDGQDYRPDPRTAQTPTEYIEALRNFRLWAGNPSYRELELRCNKRPVASTIYKTLTSIELPSRFEVIDAIVKACGGTEEDRQRFASAWRALVMPDQKARPDLRVVSDLTTALSRRDRHPRLGWSTPSPQQYGLPANATCGQAIFVGPRPSAPCCYQSCEFVTLMNQVIACPSPGTRNRRLASSIRLIFDVEKSSCSATCTSVRSCSVRWIRSKLGYPVLDRPGSLSGALIRVMAVCFLVSEQT